MGLDESEFDSLPAAEQLFIAANLERRTAACRRLST